MILDERNEFADAALIPVSAGTVVFGDVIDLVQARDIGNGQDIIWYLRLIVAAAGGTSARFQLVSADQADLTSSPNVHADTGVIALAALTPAGKTLFQGPVPQEGPAFKRYLGVLAITVGTFSGGGAVDSGLTLDKAGWRSYTDAVQ